jgi:hypothetical protein
MKSFLLISAAFAACICGAGWQLRGQTSAGVSATVQFSNGQTLAWTDLSDVVGVQPGDWVTVTVQLPASLAATSFDVSALDGSGLVNSSSVVGEDGTLTFAFQATPNAGTNRINLQNGSMLLHLQFWVLNTANPQNNPAVITPANPEN